MKIVFFGTGAFGIPTLKKLLKLPKYEIVAVVTQPDTKKGRGWNVLPSPVKAIVEKAAPHVPVFQPESLKEPDFIESIKEIGADVFVVVDYGKILGEKLLGAAAIMCINLHPSLLPKYRGAAPVNWAVMNGEKETGNTVIKMSPKMDAGGILAREKTDILEGESAPELLERLSQSGAELVIKTLDTLASGEVELEEQDETKATFAPRLKKEDGRIDWGESADRISRKIRAMQPWPGAFTYLDGQLLKIFGARSVSPSLKQDVPPGTVIDANSFMVKTGEDGALEIDVVQIEGKGKMGKREFLRGHDVARGTVLGT